MHGLRRAPQCLKVNCSAALLLPQFPPCIRVPAYQPSRGGALMRIAHQNVPVKRPLDVLPYRSGFHVSNQNCTPACILLATGNTFKVNCQSIQR